MKNKKVTVIDYGMSNTLSILRALEYNGAQVELTNSLLKIKNADYLILPGVGTFGDGMNELKKRDLIPVISSFVSKDKPFLGICLGMQMIFESSTEFGKHIGIGYIEGSVNPLPSYGRDGTKTKVPHISWNRVYPFDKTQELWKDTLFKGIEPGSYFYFVHSFYTKPKDTSNILSVIHFYGYTFPSVVNHDNIYGVQFHPEKSGRVGLKVLQNFLSL